MNPKKRGAKENVSRNKHARNVIFSVCTYVCQYQNMFIHKSFTHKLAPWQRPHYTIKTRQNPRTGMNQRKPPKHGDAHAFTRNHMFYSTPLLVLQYAACWLSYKKMGQIIRFTTCCFDESDLKAWALRNLGTTSPSDYYWYYSTSPKDAYLNLVLGPPTSNRLKNSCEGKGKPYNN